MNVIRFTSQCHKLVASLAITLTMALVSGCVAPGPLEPGNAVVKDQTQFSPLTVQNSSTEKRRPYLIRPGDELSIKFYNTPELDEDVQVLPDGTINLRLVGTVVVGDLTPAKVASFLTKRYDVELSNPQIAVIVRNVRDFKVFVGGEVSDPKIVDFTPNMSPLEAIYSAGGFLPTANAAQLVVIRKDENHKAIPYLVSMTEFINTDSPPILLQPLDIVFVPKTKIAKVSQFVDQYLSKLLLFRGIGVNFGYDLDNRNND